MLLLTTTLVGANYNERFEIALDFSQKYHAGTDQGKREDLINKLWQDLINDYPTDKAIANNYATFLIKNEHYSEAQELLEKALRYDADTKMLLENLNNIYVFQAQKAYQKVLKGSKLIKPKAKWSGLKKELKKNLDLAKTKQLDRSFEQVINQIENWRVSWEKQDLDSYLEFYASGYFADGFNGVQDWRLARKNSLYTPKFIRLILTDLKLEAISEGKVQASFFQNFCSSRFSDKVRKQLVWQFINQEWKIIAERAVKQ